MYVALGGIAEECAFVLATPMPFERAGSFFEATQQNMYFHQLEKKTRRVIILQCPSMPYWMLKNKQTSRIGPT